MISWYDYCCRKKLFVSKCIDKYLGDILFEEWCLNEMKWINIGFFFNRDFKLEVDFVVLILLFDIFEKYFFIIIGKLIYFK